VLVDVQQIKGDERQREGDMIIKEQAKGKYVNEYLVSDRQGYCSGVLLIP
jgi:hypothetical protein